MSTSLPEHPNLDQLRRQAKELRDAARSGDAGALDRFSRHHRAVTQGEVTLAAAQLVIARELGFASWPRLKAAVDARASTPEGLADAFVLASIEQGWREAVSILQAHPSIADHSIYTAAVLGDVLAVSEMLVADPSLAVAIDEARGWPPLLYACYSRWHQIDPAREPGIAAVARLLLDTGASPNTNNAARPHHGYRSALHSSVVVNNPVLTGLLLERGAQPNDGESLYHAAGHRDHACLDLLLSHGAIVSGTWALEVAVHNDDAVGVTRLLNAGAGHGEPIRDLAASVLPDAAATASSETVGALLIAGADPESRDPDGVSALRCAVRAGNRDAASRLLEQGASDDSTDIDRFIGACLRADRSAGEQLLGKRPDLRDQLTDDDRAAVVDAAGSGPPEAVALMLDLGFSPHARNGLGEQPLHTAAYGGNAEVVRLLIDAGAELDSRDANFDGTPLAYATVGSGEQASQPGNWIETVRLLVDAGASKEGAWISGKPPSEEVSSLLRGYGITPDDRSESEPGGDDADDAPRSFGTGVMADVACHLEAAYRDLDLELLGSLLHPQVRWTGLCNSSAEVLDWYRGLLADGTHASVESVEVDRGVVVLGLSVARQAEGARPARPQRLYQVFKVQDAQVVEIRGYPDRASALARE
ncbi:MAG: ankyrin repeat domain-containing protein [Acidimicrobiales bacterium]